MDGREVPDHGDDSDRYSEYDLLDSRRDDSVGWTIVMYAIAIAMFAFFWLVAPNQ